MRKMLIGGAVLIGWILWESLVHWSMVVTIIENLRDDGEAGKLMADLILSLPFRLALCLAGFAIMLRGFWEHRQFMKAGGHTIYGEGQHDALSPLTASPPVFSPQKTIVAPPASADKTKRIFVPKSVTPEYLMGLFKSQTIIQADKLIEPYINKWIETEGSLSQVTSRSWPEVCANVILRFGEYQIHLTFDKTWIERLSMIRRKDNIRVRGTISQVRTYSIDLENGEIVDQESEALTSAG